MELTKENLFTELRKTYYCYESSYYDDKRMSSIISSPQSYFMRSEIFSPFVLQDKHPISYDYKKLEDAVKTLDLWNYVPLRCDKTTDRYTVIRDIINTSSSE